MRQRMGMVLAAGILAGWAATASGYPVTFEFGGTMTEVFDPDNAFAGRVNVGDAFAGSFTFDSTLEDSLPQYSEYGSYQAGQGALQVNIGSLVFSGTEESSLGVVNAAYDRLQFSGGTFMLDNLVVEGIVAAFSEASGSIFTSDSLPLSPPPLTAFDEARLGMEGHLVSDPQVMFGFEGTITYLVPEPATILFGTLAAGVALWRRRRSV